MSETTITPSDLPAETPTLLAGKFTDTAALEAGYRELERKLGERQSTPAHAEPPAAASDPAPAGTPEGTEAATQEAAEAYAASIGAALEEVAGGKDEAAAILAWGKTAEPSLLGEGLVEAYNTALDSGNVALVKLAAKAVREAYEEANGTQGKRVVAESVPVSSGVRGYETKAEMMKVLKSAEYKRGDKATHDLHQRRLSATSFNGLA
jgi:hypothetical protein